MKKKKGGGGGASWMDTYGDMVTLLLCFFVLLYSMSTISEENWKALVMSFNPDAVPTMTETSGENGPFADDEPENDTDSIAPEEMSQSEIDETIEDLYKALLEYSQQEGMESTLSVTRDEESGRVYVTFNETAFFDGNKADLREESYAVLDGVNVILSKAANAIDEVQIQGHTAQEYMDRPNTTKTDRELSSQRATNVLIYIQDNSDLTGAQLVSVGLGQWYPVASNDTSDGRAQNRRVELIISGRNLDEELDTNDLMHYEITK